MIGNVSEWCWDWYGTPYAGGADPKGPSSGTFPVLRGGSWSQTALYSRIAFRSTLGVPDSGSYDIGFRTVLMPNSP